MTPRETIIPRDDESDSSSDEDAVHDRSDKGARRRRPPQQALVHQSSSALQFLCPRLSCSAQQPLGLIFDLDGTLVAELEEDDPHNIARSDHLFLRPGARAFLQWCRQRGHFVAVWTAAHSSWAHYVTWKLQCDFDFVWDATKLRKRRRIPVDAHGLETGRPSRTTCTTPDSSAMASRQTCCCWCGPYRNSCDRCECATGGVYQCPCRFTKDLNKVWGTASLRNRFAKSRTLLIENTPQQCVKNFGNAIYVPTYQGSPDDAILLRLHQLILEMENIPDVRSTTKCTCPQVAVTSQRRTTGAPHACWSQSWWSSCPPTAPTKDSSTTILVPDSTVVEAVCSNRESSPIGEDRFDEASSKTPTATMHKHSLLRNYLPSDEAPLRT